jgi:hypothetical protein
VFGPRRGAGVDEKTAIQAPNAEEGRAVTDFYPRI